VIRYGRRRRRRRKRDLCAQLAERPPHVGRLSGGGGGGGRDAVRSYNTPSPHYPTATGV